MNKTPKLRFKEFREPYKRTQFNDCVSIRNGQVDPCVEPYCDMPHIGPGNMEKFTGRLLEVRTAKEDGQMSGKYLFDKDDVLYGKINPHFGKVVFPKYEGLCSADTYPLKASKGMISSYLFYSLQTSRFLKYSISVSMRTGMPKINREELSLYNFNLPSKEEQEKIASFFSLIDDKISLQGEKVEALKDYKNGMMQKIFSRELRFKDDDGRDYPEWEEKKIKDIFTVTRGVVIAKTEISNIKDASNKYPVYSSQTSNNGILGYDSGYDFEGDYLTWTTDGANAGKVFRRSGKFRCTNVCGVLVENEDTLGFANKMISEILNKETPKHVSYVGNPKLMNGAMGDIKIKVPVIDEQIKIAKILDSIDLKIEKEQEKLDYLNEYKKGLLQQMFV